MSTSTAVANPATVVADSPTSSAQTPRPRRSKPVSAVPHQEITGRQYCDKLRAYIATRKGRFVKDEDGAIFVLFDRWIVPLSQSPDNVDISSLMIDACGVTTVLVPARIAVQRLLVHAKKEASKIQSRSFSTVSKDGARVYIPTADGSVLQISADRIQTVSNIENPDSVWIKHPKDEAFRYMDIAPRDGLNLFEELLVETQACKHPEMRWFVAMHEGLFPFVRDLASSRIIVLHQGGTQQGKTTGAERFTRLHGLGSVTGNATVAALRNEPDPGLLVLDNKEHVNLTVELIEHLLFLSTGAEPKRSRSDGAIRPSNKTRPVGVITSIEGVFKPELRARCAEVKYSVSGGRTEREAIERRVVDQRHVINSSLVRVLQRFLSIQALRKKTPNPFGNFDVHFTALCNLLRAFAELADKPEEWAEAMINSWDRYLRHQDDGEEESSELEYPIRKILQEQSFFKNLEVQSQAASHLGRRGTLYTTTAAWLLSELQKQPALQSALPRNPAGLTRRLPSEKFLDFKFLRTGESPDVERTASRRAIGFFFPDDTMTTNDDAVR
jgi:hypothetical protein